MSRRWAAIAFAAIVIAAGVTVELLEWRREHEWAHGGDALHVVVELRLVEGQAMGEQAVAARVTWAGSPVEEGFFRLMALDARTVPPRPLAVATTGLHAAGWSSAYAVFGERTDWLAGVTSSTLDAAVRVPAARDGTATADFHAQPEGRRLTGPADVILVLFYVDPDGDLRWARKIHG